MTCRIALALEYDGHGLCGWQRQDNGPTVQAYLEDALARMEGAARPTVAAGRTDAGVHAEAMLVHADVSAERFSRAPLAYVHGLNQHLPERIRVLAARGVAADFHARFQCLERAYRYQIWNRPTAPAIHRWRHWWQPRPMEIERMREAAAMLIGRHDFSSFRSSGCQASEPVRELREVRIERHGWCICVHLRADAFLYHMVRNIVGALARVGTGQWSLERFEEAFKARDRARSADMAPAHGLYFTNAVYDGFDSASLAGAASPV